VETVGWNPWRVLRAREHLRLTWAPLAPGRGRIEDLPAGFRRITLDITLERRERSEVLGHELIHDEFDLLWPPGTPSALIVKGERFVDRVNAERTIPMGALAGYVERRLASDLTVTPLDVAEEFDVTEQLAELALRLLPR
jgi:hypothetical protein